jgi:hypothetical protein
MIDFIKDIGSSSRVQAIVIAWLAPLLLGMFAFVIVELPEVRDSAPIRQVAVAIDLLGANRFLFMFVAGFDACYISLLESEISIQSARGK